MFIHSKFRGKCAETGRLILKGQRVFWDKAFKKVFCEHSDRFKSETDKTDKENSDLGNYIQANEDAYFDNFCQQNNI